MLKKIIATALLVVFLHAENEKFQVIATDVKTKENNILVATGNVVIFSPTYYITAQKIIYDKENETFELFDDVMIVKNNNVQTKSDYAFLDIKTDGIYQKPTMYYDSETLVWMSSKESEKKNNKIFIEDSIISSCDCVDPDWSIRSSSADFDTENKWLNIYNPRLYFKEIPILYSPYLGFSTSKKRESGLLMPSFGYSNDEGTIYSQPIFIAPEDNYDFEIIPQIRTLRGKGLYVYYRYADSKDSILNISTGYFKEKSSYFEEYDLRNKEHYGINLDYEKFNVFNKDSVDVKSGLYLNINYLNDIEYKTLESDKYSYSREKNVESKINYVYNTPDYFLGSYFRYYIDIDKDSNTTTLQELPKLQAHSYMKNLFFDRLIYSSDFKYTNHFREVGLKVDQFELKVPFSYSYSFFDDYLYFIGKQEISLNKFNYSSNLFKDATYAESNTTISLNSDLIKPYENFLHSVNLNVNYINANTIKNDGDIYNINVFNTSLDLSSFPVEKSEDKIKLNINQSFYDKNSLKEIVKHKLSQSLLYDDYNDLKYQNLENEITYNYLLGTIKNRLVYNQQDKKIVESSSSFSLTYENLYFKLGHYLSRESLNAQIDEDLESYQIDSKYKIDDKYSMGVYTDYNLKENIRNKLGYKFSINESCWDLDLIYQRELEPVSGSEPISQNVLYFQLFLKPIGGIRQEY